MERDGVVTIEHIRDQLESMGLSPNDQQFLEIVQKILDDAFPAIQEAIEFVMGKV